MNIQEAKEELCRTIKAYTAKNEAGLYRIPQLHRRPILLMGPPGIGKTAVVEQAAMECGVAFLSYAMTHHTRQSAIGLPVIREQTFRGESCSVTEYTMSEIVADILRTMEETGKEEGVLFLDEINCVSETLLPTMLRLLQFKTFGSHRLPEGWIIAAAGNPPRYNRSAREFDIVTLDRVRLLTLEPDLDAWRTYALRRNIHGSVLSYLSLKPEHFYVFRRTDLGKEFVTPRSWEDLSRTLELYEELALPAGEAFFSQYLQCAEVCTSFASYYRLYRSLSTDTRLEALTSSGQLPEHIPNLAEAPADERLCIAEYLIQNLHRQLGAWKEHQLLFQSLSYFVNGLVPLQPDFPSLESICQEQLEKRRSSLQKKKEFGLLPRQEEERELLLADTIKAWASEARLRGLRTDTSGSESRQISDVISVMKSLAADAFKELEQEALRLESVLRASVSFAREAFRDGLTACLFFTELLEQPETAEFLKKRMSTEYEICRKEAQD